MCGQVRPCLNGWNNFHHACAALRHFFSQLSANPPGSQPSRSQQAPPRAALAPPTPSPSAAVPPSPLAAAPAPPAQHTPVPASSARSGGARREQHELGSQRPAQGQPRPVALVVTAPDADPVPSASQDSDGASTVVLSQDDSDDGDAADAVPDHMSAASATPSPTAQAAHSTPTPAAHHTTRGTGQPTAVSREATGSATSGAQRLSASAEGGGCEIEPRLSPSAGLGACAASQEDAPAPRMARWIVCRRCAAPLTQRVHHGVPLASYAGAPVLAQLAKSASVGLFRAWRLPPGSELSAGCQRGDGPHVAWNDTGSEHLTAQPRLPRSVWIASEDVAIHPLRCARCWHGASGASTTNGASHGWASTCVGAVVVATGAQPRAGARVGTLWLWSAATCVHTVTGGRGDVRCNGTHTPAQAALPTPPAHL